jgi:hypothetical protein
MIEDLQCALRLLGRLANREPRAEALILKTITDLIAQRSITHKKNFAALSRGWRVNPTQPSSETSSSSSDDVLEDALEEDLGREEDEKTRLISESNNERGFQSRKTYYETHMIYIRWALTKLIMVDPIFFKHYEYLLYLYEEYLIQLSTLQVKPLKKPKFKVVLKKFLKTYFNYETAKPLFKRTPLTDAYEMIVDVVLAKMQGKPYPFDEVRSNAVYP